jgi:flagellar biosynthesis/type III secretory pathway protein FliH
MSRGMTRVLQRLLMSIGKGVGMTLTELENTHQLILTMTTGQFEQWLAEYTLGISQGWQTGYDEGYSDGYNDGDNQ